MRGRSALVAALAVLAVLVGACTGPGSGTSVAPPPGDPVIAVDTPDLVALRALTDLEPCVPGTADGALPAVTLACLGGGPALDLSLLGGPRVINLWASSCAPCRFEMPILQEFHETYGDRVPVLGVDLLDTYPGIALEQVRRRGVTYPQVADPGGELLETPAFARARGLPVLAVIDEAGEVAELRIGEVSSLQELVGLVEGALGTDLAAPA